MNDALRIQYNRRREDYLQGRISAKEWIAYCEELLEGFLYENQDMLARMKHQ